MQSPTLHGEDGGYESTTCLFIGILRHDGGGERVVTADTKAEPEAEEAKGRDDTFCGVAKGET